MANRSNVWAAMYGDDEEIDGLTQQTSKKMVANNRRFLSAQPPFATDDDSNRPAPTHSQVHGANPFASESSGLRLPDQAQGRLGATQGQRSREMFGATAVGGEHIDFPAKKQKTGAFDQHNHTAHPSSSLERVDGYGPGDLSADMADVADFAFQNNVERCEMFLDALSTNLKICQEKERPDVVATMARELEKVVDALNK